LTGLLLALFAAFAVVPPAAVAASPPASVRAFGVRATSVASNYAGSPYLWGGTSPRGFDCSGYTQFVYRRLGVNIPRTAQAQFDGSHKVGKRVREGDLVFFFRTSPRTVFHVGIYGGENRVWHAGRPGTGVHLERIWTTQWTGGRY
jgi:cell wall-associated NlpC family hydrolase